MNQCRILFSVDLESQISGLRPVLVLLWSFPGPYYGLFYSGLVTGFLSLLVCLFVPISYFPTIAFVKNAFDEDPSDLGPL